MSNPTGRRLAERVKKPDLPLAGQAMVLRRGTIVSASAGRATVTLGGDTTELPGVPYDEDKTFVAGDEVFLGHQPPMLVILFKVPA